MAFGFCLNSEPRVFAQVNQVSSKLQTANTAVDQAFNAVFDAEKAGANVSSLLTQLTVAADDVAQAENAYRTGDSNSAAVQADSALPIAQQVITEAQDAKQNATASQQNTFWSTTALTVIGTIVFILALFLGWRRFKRSYISRLFEAKPTVNTQ